MGSSSLLHLAGIWHWRDILIVFKNWRLLYSNIIPYDPQGGPRIWEYSLNSSGAPGGGLEGFGLGV